MPEYHLLKVENKAGSQTYHLNTTTIIIGRNTLSGIRIEDDQLMSHHAILRQIQVVDQRHAFTLIVRSGDIKTFHDGHWHQKTQLHKTLVTGDHFQLGNTRFSYLIAYMSESDYDQHFDAQPVLEAQICHQKGQIHDTSYCGCR